MEYASIWNGLWVILMVATGFLAFFFNIDCVNKKERKTGILLLILFVIITMIFLFGQYKMCKMPKNWTKTANESLVSLSDNNMMNSRIYARRGYINENLWYQYMVDVGGGGYVANKVPSNRTTVYFTDENPRCEWYRISQKWWIFERYETRWKLYVPEGAVGNDFTIDLQ